MKKCNFCNNTVQDEDIYCKFCGKKIEDSPANNDVVSDGDNRSITSLFLKYAGYLDDNVLYRVAWAKEKQILKSEYPEEAEEIFKLLAFKGHLDSMYHYARILLEKPTPDEELAYRWVSIAAGRGHAPSKNLLKTYNWTTITAKEPDKIETGSQNNLMTFQIPNGCDSCADVINEVIGSVLMISSTVKGENGTETNCGSGFVLDNGLVVTNAHVIGDDPECIEANFEQSIDDKAYTLYPVLLSEEYDIAVLALPELTNNILKVKGVKLSSQPVTYGQDVFTIGNPLGMGFSVSRGIVSCPNRETNYPQAVDSVIQTDITINHGNSGGALFNLDGEVVGIATFVPSDSEGGIGMCIPSTYIKEIIEKSMKRED